MLIAHEMSSLISCSWRCLISLFFCCRLCFIGFSLSQPWTVICYLMLLFKGRGRGIIILESIWLQKFAPVNKMSHQYFLFVFLAEKFINFEASNELGSAQAEAFPRVGESGWCTARAQSEAWLLLSNLLFVSLPLPCNVYIIPCTPIINDRAHVSHKG